MDVFTVIVLGLDLVCTLVLVLCIYHVLRWALSRVSDWRESNGRRAWSARRCFVLALLASISFIL